MENLDSNLNFLNAKIFWGISLSSFLSLFLLGTAPTHLFIIWDVCELPPLSELPASFFNNPRTHTFSPLSISVILYLLFFLSFSLFFFIAFPLLIFFVTQKQLQIISPLL